MLYITSCSTNKYTNSRTIMISKIYSIVNHKNLKECVYCKDYFNINKLHKLCKDCHDSYGCGPCLKSDYESKHNSKMYTCTLCRQKYPILTTVKSVVNTDYIKYCILIIFKYIWTLLKYTLLVYFHIIDMLRFNNEENGTIVLMFFYICLIIFEVIIFLTDIFMKYDDNNSNNSDDWDYVEGIFTFLGVPLIIYKYGKRIDSVETIFSTKIAIINKISECNHIRWVFSLISFILLINSFINFILIENVGEIMKFNTGWAIIITTLLFCASVLSVFLCISLFRYLQEKFRYLQEKCCIKVLNDPNVKLVVVLA